MIKTELLYREVLYQVIEKNNRTLTQAGLARALNVSLSTVNSAIKKLENLGAINIKPRAFQVIDVKKALYFWASVRHLQKDIIYKTRIKKPVKEIEKLMPDDAIFASYTAYKFLFKDVPADYSEVYVYGDESLKKRFKESDGTPNFFVLKKDRQIEKYGKTTTIANTFVDLWNLKEWYSKEFIRAMEERLHGILE